MGTGKRRHKDKDPKPCRRNTACAAQQSSRGPVGGRGPGMLPRTGGSGADIATLRSQWKGKAPTRPDTEVLWEGELPVSMLASHLTAHKPLWRTDFPQSGQQRVRHKTLRGVLLAGTQQGVRTWGHSAQRPPRTWPRQREDPRGGTAQSYQPEVSPQRGDPGSPRESQGSEERLVGSSPAVLPDPLLNPDSTSSL